MADGRNLRPVDNWPGAGSNKEKGKLGAGTGGQLEGGTAGADIC